MSCFGSVGCWRILNDGVPHLKQYFVNEIAIRIRELSREWFGNEKEIHFVGQSKRIQELQRKLVRFAQLDEPILVTGESGVGKEIISKSIYLLTARRGKPFVCVNCAQYYDQNTMISELFGHKKGSFTGAMRDHNGIFKDCDGGVIFLDEVGELSPKSQAMLLRVLAEGEIRALGSTKSEFVNVRVIAATNRNLKEMIKTGHFREDLYYRLRHLCIHVPPLRERDNDWKLIADHTLRLLCEKYGIEKTFSTGALRIMANYQWPGNVREISSVIATGYSLSGEAEEIAPEDFEFMLNPDYHAVESENTGELVEYYSRMTERGESFWQVIQKPYLERELNRSQVKSIVRRGLSEVQGSYKSLLNHFSMTDGQYLKFMDFLRHHRLKP